MRTDDHRRRGRATVLYRAIGVDNRRSAWYVLYHCENGWHRSRRHYGCPAARCWLPATVGHLFAVDDVDATARKAQELGAKTIMPLTDIPNVGRFYTFQDPQGAVISIITYRMEGAAV